MNDGSRTKKNSTAHKNPQHHKITLHQQSNLGSRDLPKNPPNISKFYQEINTTKKKDTLSKLKGTKQSGEAKNAYHPQFRNSHLGDDRQIQNAKIVNTNGIHRLSNSKKEKKNESKVLKNIKEIHLINKPHHKLRHKGCNKQNRPPRSTFDSRDQKLSHVSKIGKTEAFGEDDKVPICNLICDEIIATKITKIKKRMKNFSQEVYTSSSFQQSSSINPNSKMLFNNHMSPNLTQKIMDPAEQIKEFDKLNDKMLSQLESEALTQLFHKQKAYFTTQNFTCYLERNQPNISWFKRAIAINWMMEVSENFGCRRQLLAIAVNLLDRYLALSRSINIDQLQKIACGCMCISNKVDGIVFNIQTLSQQTQNITIKQIADLEQKITKKLGWKLNPPTANMWANRISLQWDMYLDHEQANLCPLIKDNLHIIKFKTEDTEGYNNFRSLMQYIDMSLMDIHTLRYHSRELAASLIYLILNVRLQMFSVTDIYSKFPLKSDYLINDSQLNYFYNQFVKDSFGFALQDLLPTIQFCATFFILPLCFRLPLIVQKNTDECDITFEQLCSYQTVNQSNLATLRKRNRQYD